MSSLTAYFSYSGTTRKAAEKVAEKTGSDLFEIKAAQPYTAADVNWQDKSSRNVLEANDEKSRPAIADKTDISKYDTIYLGFPVWWYIQPRIINTFLDSYDFSGKKVVPFITSGSSSVEGSVKNLRKEYPSIQFTDGMRITSDADIDALIRQ